MQIVVGQESTSKPAAGEMSLISSMRHMVFFFSPEFATGSWRSLPLSEWHPVLAMAYKIYKASRGSLSSSAFLGDCPSSV